MSAPRREDPAVEALAAAIEPIIDYSGDLPWSQSQGPRAQNVARTVLAAIARNEVPGVTLAADRESDGLRAAVEALADWHGTKAEKARRFRPEVNGENPVMDKAADVHEDADRRLRALLAAHPATDQPERPAARYPVLAEVAAERDRQEAKWGQQDHPDGTGSVWEWCSGQHAGWAQDAADDARRRCQEAPDRTWGDTYALILNEEVAEAFAEEEPAALRRELLQVAAVAVAWVECIDRRSTDQPEVDRG